MQIQTQRIQFFQQQFHYPGALPSNPMLGPTHLQGPGVPLVPTQSPFLVFAPPRQAIRPAFLDQNITEKADDRSHQRRAPSSETKRVRDDEEKKPIDQEKKKERRRRWIPPPHLLSESEDDSVEEKKEEEAQNRRQSGARAQPEENPPAPEMVKERTEPLMPMGGFDLFVPDIPPSPPGGWYGADDFQPTPRQRPNLEDPHLENTMGEWINHVLFREFLDSPHGARDQAPAESQDRNAVPELNRDRHALRRRAVGVNPEREHDRDQESRDPEHRERQRHSREFRERQRHEFPELARERERERDRYRERRERHRDHRDRRVEALRFHQHRMFGGFPMFVEGPPDGQTVPTGIDRRLFQLQFQDRYEFVYAIFTI